MCDRKLPGRKIGLHAVIRITVAMRSLHSTEISVMGVEWGNRKYMDMEGLYGPGTGDMEVAGPPLRA